MFEICFEIFLIILLFALALDILIIIIFYTKETIADMRKKETKIINLKEIRGGKK